MPVSHVSHVACGLQRPKLLLCRICCLTGTRAEPPPGTGLCQHPSTLRSVCTPAMMIIRYNFLLRGLPFVDSLFAKSDLRECDPVIVVVKRGVDLSVTLTTFLLDMMTKVRQRRAGNQLAL